MHGPSKLSVEGTRVSECRDACMYCKVQGRKVTGDAKIAVSCVSVFRSVSGIVVELLGVAHERILGDHYSGFRVVVEDDSVGGRVNDTMREMTMHCYPQG